MTPERLDEIRERANLQCGLDGDDADDLLEHVDHLTAENARLREGFRWVYETALEDIGPCMSDGHDEHDGTEYMSSHCHFPFAKQTRYLRGPSETAPEEKP